jgi:hypothetical protein
LSVSTIAVLAGPLVLLCTGALLTFRLAKAGPEPASPRRPLAWRGAGIVVGLLAAVYVLYGGSLSRGLLLSAPVFGLFVLVGTLLGELTEPPPAGAIRRAGLRVRRVSDYLPMALGSMVAAGTLALFVLAGLTTAAGSADDQGRAGRSLSCLIYRGSAGHEPWPGSYYTVPGLGLVLAGLILAGLVLHRVVRRPQPAGSAEADDARRRRSAEAVTAATGILVLVPLLGIAVSAGFGLGELADTCGHSWWGPAGTGLSATAGLAFVGAAWCLAVLLTPRRSRVRSFA